MGGTYSNPLIFSNASNSFTGNGAALTSLNASNIGSGSLSAARLPTGGAWSLATLLNIDAGTLAIDPSSNRVGIGNGAPQSLFHVGGAYNASVPSAIARIAGDLGVNGTLFSDQGSLLSRSPANGSPVATLVLDSSPATLGATWFVNSNALNSPFGSPELTFTISNGEDRITIEPAGDVGIGLPNPLQQLHVAANIRANGNIMPATSSAA